MPTQARMSSSLEPTLEPAHKCLEARQHLYSSPRAVRPTLGISHTRQARQGIGLPITCLPFRGMDVIGSLSMARSRQCFS